MLQAAMRAARPTARDKATTAIVAQAGIIRTYSTRKSSALSGLFMVSTSRSSDRR